MVESLFSFFLNLSFINFHFSASDSIPDETPEQVKAAKVIEEQNDGPVQANDRYAADLDVVLDAGLDRYAILEDPAYTEEDRP